MGNNIHDKNMKDITRSFLEEEMSEEELLAIQEQMQTNDDFAEALSDEVVNEYNRAQLKKRLQAIDKGITTGKYNASHSGFSNWWFIPIGLIVVFSMYWFGIRNKMNSNELSQISAARKNKIKDCAIIDSLNKTDSANNKSANISDEENKHRTSKSKANNEMHENATQNPHDKPNEIHQRQNQSNMKIPFSYSNYDVDGIQLHCYLVKGKNDVTTINQILFDGGKLEKIKEKIKYDQKSGKASDTYTFIELRHLGVPLTYLKKGEYEYQELLKKVWLQNFRVSKKMENKIKEASKGGFTQYLITPKNTNYFVKNESIRFDWTKNPADTFDLSIFTGELKEVFRETIDAPVQLKLNFPEGIYYWQLTKGEYTYHTGRFFIVTFPD